MVRDSWFEFVLNPTHGGLIPLGQHPAPKGKRFRPRKVAVHVGMAQAYYFLRLRKQHYIIVRQLSRMEFE
jgi:hypothetical protein